MIFYLLLLLLKPGRGDSEMGCYENETNCIRYPDNCTGLECTWVMKYKPLSGDTTKIEIFGRPDELRLNTYKDNMWLAFGFSPHDSGMSDMTIYACQRVGGTNYTVRKLPSSGYNVVNSESMVISKTGTLRANYYDGVMSCTFEILNRHLPSQKEKMVNCPMGGENRMWKHKVIPKRTPNAIKLQVEEDDGDKVINKEQKKGWVKFKKQIKKQCLMKGLKSTGEYLTRKNTNYLKKLSNQYKKQCLEKDFRSKKNKLNKKRKKKCKKMEKEFCSLIA